MIQSTRPLWALVVLLLLLLSACAPGLSTTEGATQPSSPAPASTDPASPATAVATSTPRDTPCVVPAKSAEPSTPTPTDETTPGTAGQETRSPPMLPAAPEPSPLPESGLGPQGVPEELLEDMVADLAARLQVRPDQISLVKAEAVTWRDSSLGCPEKGVSYLQVLTPGFRVVLSHGSAAYDYRADQRGRFFLCQENQP